MILNVINDPCLLTFLSERFQKSAGNFDIALRILSQINRAEIVVIGIAQTFVFVKNRIVKGGERTDLILQTGLQVQRVHIDAVPKNKCLKNSMTPVCDLQRSHLPSSPFYRISCSHTRISSLSRLT